MPDWASSRQMLGVLIKDMPRYLPALYGAGKRYLALCNRNEVLLAAPDGDGYQCQFQWTSDLHAPKVWPNLGVRLMRRALRDHPIERREAPISRSRAPEVTFIIGHRGLDRLPHLFATLESIAGQRNVAVECIVVEQDVVSHLSGRLPAWVQHVFSPPPSAAMPYCRSWAFNIGARQARAELLVLHDNDILVPADYTASALTRARAGFDVIALMRFGFYLGAEQTANVFAGQALATDEAPETILQNICGGGTVAIRRDAYWRIGGMDEGFVGWGGEDDEFWERAQTLTLWSYGCLPYVHLWHPKQPEKDDRARATHARFLRMTEIAPARRIAALRALPCGQASGPAGWIEAP